jgi:hypothetical protein
MTPPSLPTNAPWKSLDEKLARIVADPSCRDFILADAKDADMAAGIAAPGPRQSALPGTPPWRSLPEFRQAIREIVQQGLVDIMLMSPCTSELLTIDEDLFADSQVTPAVRANDSTDIWCGNSGQYAMQPSLPFRSATVRQLVGEATDASSMARTRGPNLGLYSITFNNDAARDRETLAAYQQFREEAEPLGFRHFLEVFAPNALLQPVANVGRYVNDCIVRTLAGIPRRQRPVFLKMPYFGPAAMEELAAYDPALVIGILGGSGGTTLSTFQLLHDAKHHGARAALFGRRINQAEDQLSMVRHLRLVADGQLDPHEAVRSYHADLAKLGIKATD